MIFTDGDFLGSRPARRADGKPWEAWQLDGGRPARSADAPTVTTDCHKAVAEEQIAHSAHLKSADLDGRNGAQAHAREEAVQHATEIKLRAECKAGEILRDTPKNEWAHGSKVTGDRRELVKDETPTLADLGVTKKESSRSSPVEPPSKLLSLLARHPEGVSVRDVLRARLAPDTTAAADLLNGLARTGHLTRHEDHPASGGRTIVTFRLP